MPYAPILRSSCIAAAAFLLSSPAAFAGGFSAARFGGEGAHPASDHPTAVYYNPAGLALGTGTRVYGEGLFVLRIASYERPVEAIDNVVDPAGGQSGTPSDATGVNAGKATLTNFLAAPFLGVVSDLGVPNLAVSVAAYAPFGGQASWDQDERYDGDAMYPGAVDGVQRWHTIDGTLQTIYLSAAGAYRLPEARLSFGASVNVVRSSIETLRARTAAGTDDVVGPSGELLEGRSLAEVSGTDLAVGVGAIWQPMDDLWIGASYQSQPGFGEQKLSGTLTNKFGAGALDVSDIDFVQALPDVIRAGVRYRARPDLEVRVQGDYQRWSVLENQCLTSQTAEANCDISDDGSLGDDGANVIVNLRRDWNDTFGVRAGASWWANPGFEIGGSLSYDSNAVPDETMDPALMDMDKLIANATARYRLSDTLAVSGSLLHVLYFEREVAPRTDMGFAQPSRAPDGAGTYKNSVSVISLGAEYAF